MKPILTPDTVLRIVIYMKTKTKFSVTPTTRAHNLLPLTVATLAAICVIN